MTAATRESAPSNPRVGLRLTNCSYGQDSPDRKLFCEIHHAFGNGNQSFGFKVEGSKCAGQNSYAATQPSSSIVLRPVRQRHRPTASCRASALTVFFFIPAPAGSLTFIFSAAFQAG